MSPTAFLCLLAAVVLLVLVLCGTFIWALRISVKGVKGADRLTVIAEVGGALQAFMPFRRK